MHSVIISPAKNRFLIGCIVRLDPALRAIRDTAEGVKTAWECRRVSLPRYCADEGEIARGTVGAPLLHRAHEQSQGEKGERSFIRHTSLRLPEPIKL